MQKILNFYRLCFLVLLLLVISDASPAQKPADSLQDTREQLSRQVNNPNSLITQIQLKDVVTSRVPGYNGSANSLQIIPILPIPRNKIFCFDQLIKITIQLPTVPGPVNETGLGDISLVDVGIIKRTWGEWGAGLTFVFPTATSEILGQGKWQIGPSLAFMYTKIHNLIIGAIIQNQISFAGDPSRPAVNTLLLTPTCTWTLNGGWFVGYSDIDWSYDWRNDHDLTIPLGIQAGKVHHLGKLPLSVSAEAAWMGERPDYFPEWFFGFECIFIFPGARL